MRAALVACCLFACTILAHAGNKTFQMNGPVGWDNVSADNVPPELRSFWQPIIDHWMTDLYQGPQADQRALEAINRYCVSYAARHRDPGQVGAMVEDVAQHPSEVRAMFYSEVVVRLDKTKVRPILDEYARRGTAKEKTAANDFVSDLEEIDSGANR